MIPDAAITFAVIQSAWIVGHHVGDRWLQTDHQAAHKGDHPRHANKEHCNRKRGWIAASAHVTSYTACTALLVVLLWWRFDLPITMSGYLLGQLFSAGTHLIIDRRWTLRRFIEHVTPWSRNYYDKVPGGAEHLDQSAHYVCILLAALITVSM